jgi:hypothetical protein
MLYSRIANALKRQSNPQVVLEPQDLIVLLELLVTGKRPTSFAELSAELSMDCGPTLGARSLPLPAFLTHRGVSLSRQRLRPSHLIGLPA